MKHDLGFPKGGNKNVGTTRWTPDLKVTAGGWWPWLSLEETWVPWTLGPTVNQCSLTSE